MRRDFYSTLLCLRRGPVEPEWEQTALGQKDVPLAKAAQRREGRVRKCIAVFKPAVILSSDLVRAAGTASALATELGVKHVARRDLREQRYGAWQGRPWSEIIATEAEDAVTFLRDFTRATPRSGESLPRMRARVVRALLAECRRRPRQVLCYVGHAAPIRAIIATALGLELQGVQRLRIDPFGLSIVQFQGPTAALTLLNHPATGASPAEALL